MDSNIYGTSAPASASGAKSLSTEQFTFTGSGGEYFRIWIVNLLLTIVTLGIYSAWAKVRRMRYFYGSTQLAGSSFEYHGEALKILKGRLIALALIIPYSIASNSSPILAVVFLIVFFIALPFIVVTSRRFQTRMSSWRNIRFGFTGRYGQAAWVYLGLAILIPLTLGLIVPYMMYARQQFLLGNATFGTTQVEFNAKPGRYYLLYLLGIATLIGTFVAAGVFAFISFGGLSGLAELSDPTVLAGGDYVGAMLLLIVIVIAGYLFTFAIIQAGLTNAAYGELALAGHEVKCDVSAVRLAGIYFTNALFMILTLGLYTPWAKVRLVRYQLENMQVLVSGDLNQFAAEQQQQQSATGEEIGDLMDMDFGL
jgi:uncharacterized membrane protein YjgN (DUF898 family)